MPAGPGIYDDICTKVREETQAALAIVLVVGGIRGGGFSVQTRYPQNIILIPQLLRDMANDIEKSTADALKQGGVAST